MAQGTAAREAAFQILKSARSGTSFEAAHSEAVDGLPEPDRRLAYEIAAGVLRRQTQLDSLLKPLLTSGWDRTAEDLKDLLRIGAYQLTRLDRIPSYAAVQATVEVAKRNKGPRGASLINAVLRRVARMPGGTVAAREPSTASELAEAESHPAWLVERWATRFGLERTARLLRHNNMRPQLTIQPVGWSIDKLRDSLESRRIEVFDAPSGAGLVVRGEKVENLPGYGEGAFVVQDAAQALLLQFAQVPAGAVVWDACAAPGGKTAVLSRRGPVVATERNRDRIPRLQDTLARTAPGVPIAVADAAMGPIDPAGIDVVLVDVPCSATGSLAHHPDSRWRLTERAIRNMVERQAILLDGIGQCVRVDGLMVYLTCSLEQEENGEQIDRFLEQRPEFEREGEDLFLFPPDSGTDGGFGARLRRVR